MMQRNVRLGAGCGRFRVSFLAMSAMALLLGSAGCSEKNASTAPAPGNESGPIIVAEPAPPSLAELQSRLGLTAEQSTALEPPLGAWQTAHDEMMARLRAGEGEAAGPEYGLGGEIEPPHLRFLEEATPLLTREQLRALARYLEERRETARLRLGPEGQRPGPGSPLERIVRVLREEFQLTNEQMTQLREAVRKTHEAFRTLHTAYIAGTISAEDVRDGVATALDTLQGEAGAILGVEAFERLAGLLDQEKSAVAQRLLDTLQARTDRHLEFLTRVLVLDPSQQEAVRTALEAARQGMEPLLTEVRDGTISFPEALYREIGIHATLRAAIRTALTQDQLDLLEALRPLLRHDPPLPLYFGGGTGA